MSKETHAKDFRREAIRGVEALQQTDHDLLQKLNAWHAGDKANGLSPDAYKSQLEELKDKMDGAVAYAKRAAEMEESIRLCAREDARHDSLANTARPRAPQYLDADPAPAGKMPDEPGERDAYLEQRFQSMERHMVNFEAPKPTALIEGSYANRCINKWLRPTWSANSKITSIYESLSSDDMEFLKRPPTHNFLSPFIDEDGRYIVSKELKNRMIEQRAVETGLISRVDLVLTTAGEVQFPTFRSKFNFKTQDRSGHSKVQSLRLKDIFGMTTFVPRTREIELLVPLNLVADSGFDVTGRLVDLASEVKRETDELFIIVGTGNSQPLGIIPVIDKLLVDDPTLIGPDGIGINDTAHAQIPSYTGGDFPHQMVQVFDTFLHSNARRDCIWLAGRAFERQVRFFRNEAAGAGTSTGAYLFKIDLEGAAPQRLNSFPMIISEAFPDNITSGSVNDVMFLFWNPKTYFWVERSGMNLTILRELHRLEGEIGYLFDAREDGGPTTMDQTIAGLRNA